MTVDEFANELEGKLNEIATGKAFFTSAGFLRGNMAKRIFIDGLKTDGTKSQYSGKPGVVSTKFLPKKFPDDKFQPIKGKKKKGYFGTFYEEGYKGYKKAAGRESAFVNLRMTNQLQSDFSSSLDTISPNNLVLKLKNEFNADKRVWLEDRFGIYFEPTEEEVNDFVQVVTDEINFILQR